MSIISRVLFIIVLSFSATVQAGEQLIFSIDLIRHGDRTPVYQIPKSYYHWKEGLGELTEKGVTQEKELGKKLRKKYIHQYHLLPEVYNPQTIYVRSTDFNRTIKSADALLLGLYPLSMRRLANQQIKIKVVPHNKDNLLAVKANRNVFSLLNNYFAQRKLWKEKTNHLQTKLKYWSEQTGLNLNDFNQLDKLADNLYIRKTNQISLPTGITNNDADEIISLAEFSIVNKFKLKDVTETMGNEFVKTVINYFDLAAQQKTSVKYVLLSGHDSSILSVMNTLQTPLAKIPEYATCVNFSLFKNKNKYYVKVAYNDKPVNIPACGGNTCTLSELEKLVPADSIFKIK